MTSAAHAPFVARSGLALSTLLTLSICDGGTLQRETAALPDLPAPPGGSTEWIARSMRLNGVPMTLKSFSSATQADEVLHHYERTLMRSDTKTRRTHDGEWRVLSLLARDHYVTIRARNTLHGSNGTMTVTPPLAKLTPSQHSRFPRPPTARVVSLQEYDDEGIEAEHISLTSRRSVATEAHGFAAALARAGWQLLRNTRTTDRGGGYVIEAQKAAHLALINLRRAERGGSTVITVVWRKA